MVCFGNCTAATAFRPQYDDCWSGHVHLSIYLLQGAKFLHSLKLAIGGVKLWKTLIKKKKKIIAMFIIK